MPILLEHDLGLEKEECSTIKNLVTDKIFDEDFTKAVVNCERTGSKIYEAMVKERLQPGSTVGVFDSIMKVQLWTENEFYIVSTMKCRDSSFPLRKQLVN